MTISVGVDLVDVKLLRRMLRMSTNVTCFLAAGWTAEEQLYCARDPEKLAGRWAVKEAAFKALGIGIGPYSLLEAEVSRDGDAPVLKLSGAVEAKARALGYVRSSVSISHERSLAVGFVILERDG